MHGGSFKLTCFYGNVHTAFIYQSKPAMSALTLNKSRITCQIYCKLAVADRRAVALVLPSAAAVCDTAALESSSFHGVTDP